MAAGAGAGRRADGTDGIAGRASRKRLRDSILLFLPRTAESSAELEVTGIVRAIGPAMAERVEEALARAAGPVTAIATTGTPAARMEGVRLEIIRVETVRTEIGTPGAF